MVTRHHTADAPATFDSSYDGPKPAGADWVDGGARLTVLVTDQPEDFRESIEDLGCVVESVSHEWDLLIVRAPLGRIAEIALLEKVRRVEPCTLGEPD